MTEAPDINVTRHVLSQAPNGLLVTSIAFNRPYYFPNVSAAASVRDNDVTHDEWRVAAYAACDYYKFNG